jgi:RNA methyltransferase, TrmH family
MTTVPVSTIHSRANTRVRDIRALRCHKRREETGLFFADGLHICLLAARTGTSIEQIVVSRAGLRDPRAWEFLALQEAKGVPVLDIAPDVFATLCHKESSQSVGIVLRQRLHSLTDLAPPGTPSSAI